MTLLKRASHVRPEHAVQISVTQVRVVRAVRAGVLAGGMKRDGDDGLAEQLSALIEPLTQAASRPGRVASHTAGDQHPLHQAAELARYVTNHGPELAVVQRADLLSFVSQIRPAVTALADVAGRELGSGHWLVPDTRDEAKTMWARMAPELAVPVLVSASRQSATAAGRLSLAPHDQVEAASRLSDRAPALPSVRGCLSSALSRSRVLRPALPGHAPARPRAR